MVASLYETSRKFLTSPTMSIPPAPSPADPDVTTGPRPPVLPVPPVFDPTPKISDHSITIGPWRFAAVPVGYALLGAPDDEPGRTSKQPLHRHINEEVFYLLTTEASQSLVEFALQGTCQSGPLFPATNVSFDDAQEICAKLTARIPGLHFRLPTEEEWEFAARWLTPTPLPLPPAATIDWNKAVAKAKAGDRDFLDRFAAKWACFGQSQPQRCGLLRPNALGLFDMSGNVWEWCESRSPTGDQRPMRGGAWISANVWGCTASSRSLEPRGTRKNSVGFRIIVEVR